MGHDSFEWDMTHSNGTYIIHAGHDSLFIWNKTHSNETCILHVGHDSFTRDTTHSYGTCIIHMGHDSCICIQVYTNIHINVCIYIYVCICTYVYICIMLIITYIYEGIYMCTYTRMGWLRLVGSLKLYVSFEKYSLFYRALLQKRHVLLRSLLIVATPYVYLYVYTYGNAP